MNGKLDQIEARLQSLIEGSISLLLPKANFKQTLAHELVESMRTHLVVWPDGQIFAPSQYTIFVSPTTVKSGLSDKSFLTALATALDHAAHDAGFQFSKPPVLQITIDDRLSTDKLRVEVTQTTQKLAQTTSISLNSTSSSTDEFEVTHLHAFLIVNSTYNFRLGSSVINIGRRTDNHLVIDDLRVSREHAQLRPIKGHYVIFDLNSKGGTYVNGQRISQHALIPGDVISLAGVPLIYGQDPDPYLSNTSSILPNSFHDPHEDPADKSEKKPTKGLL